MSIQVKDNWKVEENKYKCPECGKVYSKYGIAPHIWAKHTEEGRNHSYNSGNGKYFLNEDGEIWNKGKILKDPDEVFVENSSFSGGYARKCILKLDLKEYKCTKCGNNGEWEDEKLTLHLDHINGDSRDHRLENLRFLCPNCHSQTKTYCGKDRLKSGKKVSDEKLIDALKSNYTIAEALRDVELDHRGGNYPRCRNLIKKFNITLKKRTKSFTNECVDCGSLISDGATRCRKCFKASCEKINWPSTEWLIEMTNRYSFLALSRRLGVSDNAIRKRIKNH